MSTKIPSRFPAQYLDKAIQAMSVSFVRQIHFRVDFQSAIDEDRLRRSLRLSMDAEPILGCRYANQRLFPHWQRMSKLELDNAQHLQIVEGDEATCQDALDEFLGRWVVYETDPQFCGLLLRNAGKDSLVIKVNHQVVDAGGTKELGYLLSNLYKTLGENPDYIPTPNLGSRSIWQVLRQVLPGNFFRLLWINTKQTFKNMVPYQSIDHKFGWEKKGAPIFQFLRLDKERTKAIKAYGEKRGATINDMVTTAIIRASIKNTGWNKNGQVRTVGTVDLRRFLPGEKASALCNLSGFYFIGLGLEPGNSFDETLKKVKCQMDYAKSNYIGIPFTLGSFLTSLPYPDFMLKPFVRWAILSAGRKGNFPPAMTNLGPIIKERLDFGTEKIANAEVIVPPICPPFFCTGVSGYNGTLTFSTSFYESSAPREKGRSMLNFIDQELPG